MGRPDSQDDLPETPFDVAFLTFFFLQIYVGQLIIQSAVLFWSFSLDSPHEPTALLCLDLFAIALLYVEVSSGIMSRGFIDFTSDLGGKVDFGVLVVSVVCMTLYIYFEYIVVDDSEFEEGIALAHLLKLLRDAARVLRLPVFLLHTFAVFRWYESQATQRRAGSQRFV